MSRRRALIPAVLLLALLAVAPAHAADPGRWAEVKASPITLFYYQGVAVDPDESFYFDGINWGLYRTDPNLKETAKVDNAIPEAVTAGERYNHIGDIAYDTGEGGRVLLPLECYYPGTRPSANTCGTGSIGVADPKTLKWRYYVKLDPRDIKKAMWCEVSPDGKLLWTSQDDDLLAYSMSEVRKANAAPSGKLLRPVTRLEGAVPPSGITGATFVDDRLYLAGANDSTYQVWSVDTRNGSRNLEIEKQVFGESEGLAAVEAFGGYLHWIITPIDSEGRPSTYNGNVLVTFKARKGVRPTPVATLTASKTTVKRGKRSKLTFTVMRTVGTLTLPASGAAVSFGGKSYTTDAKGRATTTVTLTKRTAASVRLPGAKTVKVTVNVS